MTEYVLSSMPHTWFFDIDGTIVKHNGYKDDGVDTILPGAKELLSSIPEDDMVVFITARKEDVKQLTLDFLERENIRYDHIIFDAPYGERIVVNDRKPSGLNMSMAVNIDRDNIKDVVFNINDSL